MHDQSKKLMAKFAKTIPKGIPILDIGSKDVNGTFHQFFHDNPYTGIDIEAGDGVDIVVSEYEYPFKDNQFEYIISGSTLEHVKKPWIWIKEVARILKIGGKLCIIVPYSHPYHEHPVDCFRIFPEGLRALFQEAMLKEIEIDMYDGTYIGIHPISGEKMYSLNKDGFEDTMGIAVK